MELFPKILMIQLSKSIVYDTLELTLNVFHHHLTPDVTYTRPFVSRFPYLSVGNLVYMF